MAGPTQHIGLSLRYRAALWTAIAGLLAFGTLLLNTITDALRERIFIFYGIDGGEYETASRLGGGAVTLTQVAMAAAILGCTGAFIVVERIRARRVERRQAVPVEVVRLTPKQLLDIFVLRAAGLAGLLLGSWILQHTLLRWQADGSLWANVDIRTLLPLASIFGVSCLVGLLCSAISLVGLRAILELQAFWEAASGRARRARPVLAFRLWRRRLQEHWGRGPSDRFGVELLSRPPPGVQGAAA